MLFHKFPFVIRISLNLGYTHNVVFDFHIVCRFIILLLFQQISQHEKMITQIMPEPVHFLLAALIILKMLIFCIVILLIRHRQIMVKPAFLSVPYRQDNRKIQNNTKYYPCHLGTCRIHTCLIFLLQSRINDIVKWEKQTIYRKKDSLTLRKR